MLYNNQKGGTFLGLFVGIILTLLVIVWFWGNLHGSKDMGSSLKDMCKACVEQGVCGEGVRKMCE